VSRLRIIPWFVPVIVAVPSGLALAAGLVLAVMGVSGEAVHPPQESIGVEIPRDAEIVVVALGDSITHGMGDDRGGYVSRVLRQLEQANRKPTLIALARPGAETADLEERMKDKAIRTAIARADLVLLSIGGNDLMRTLRGGSEAIETEPDRVRPLAVERLKHIFNDLRTINPTAPVRVLGLYNPFEVERGAEAEARDELLSWNVLFETATHSFDDILVVPIADLFLGREDRLGADRFHPGPKGHAVIAERVWSTLRLDSLGREPKTSKHR
jgi:lysophospholipase L1-like esterase